MTTVRELHETTGPIDLSAIDADSTPALAEMLGQKADRDEAEEATEDLADGLADAQERLFANGRAGTSDRKVLLVLQGMDTAGKGGVVRKVAGLVDPQGLHISSFKKPTAEELEHDFLWRVGRQMPEPGMIGVFDRSHYEDVLVGRVRELAPADEIERRYAAINQFEADFVAGGGALLKCYLHIDEDVQAERLQDRLDDPTKYWKFNPGDLDERELWPAYQEAYEIALERCSTPAAPWYVVPSGNKWYRTWAIAAMLLETLDGLGLNWPSADFDVAAARRRLKQMQSRD